jgi:O-antigen/teichoic acid export membrane protein
MSSRIFGLITFISSKINKGHNRSVQAKKNIIASFFIRGCSICISLVLVPITINYINPSRYGIWLTLSSIVGWFSFFDIGLTYGLRNKLAEAKAKGDDKSAQIYVSTTYAVLSIIFFIVWLVFICVNHFLNWSDILKVPQDMSSEISILAVIVFTYFCLQFVLKIITTLITADQQPAKSSFIDLIGQSISIIAIVILVKTTQGSLIYLGIALCISPVIALIGANIVLFRGKYEQYRPKFSKIDFSYAKGLFNLGLTFFVIQVSGTIQYESANIIIARDFRTSDVTSYNIVFKYFGMLTMLFTIVLLPFWSAATEAYLKKDYQWIRNAIKKYNMFNALVFGLGIIMLLLSDRIYTLWLGKNKVAIDFYLSFWGFISIISTIFGSKYVVFLNGISALKLQFWTSLVSPIVYIVVAYILINYYHMGVYSLFVASIIANLNGIVVAPIQYYQIIIKNKRGIWTK